MSGFTSGAQENDLNGIFTCSAPQNSAIVAHRTDVENTAVGTKRIREFEEGGHEAANGNSAAIDDSSKCWRSVESTSATESSKNFSRSKYKCSHCGQVLIFQAILMAQSCMPMIRRGFSAGEEGPCVLGAENSCRNRCTYAPVL